MINYIRSEMKEWTKLVPSKEHIGLRARFRKVIGDKVEEVVGTIVEAFCPHPWQYDVEIVCDDDKRRLSFPNGACPFYDDKDGERHYIGDAFEVEYYYQEL